MARLRMNIGQMSLGLYEHAEMISVAVAQRSLALCVSRLNGSAGRSRTQRRLLLLHGNPASMQEFRALAAVLRDEFELVAIDLPGFGRSESLRPARHESLLDTYARYVEAALRRIGWDERFYVLGHSHGAGVAQALAVLFPERVSGLILLGSVGCPAHWGYRQLALPGVTAALRVLVTALERGVPRAITRHLACAVMEPIFCPSAVPEEWLDEQLALLEARPEILVNMALVATGKPCDQLARGAVRIRAPALFIHGDSDRLVPARHSRAIYAILARTGHAEFHELGNTGHMLHLSHAEQIRSLMLEWLARVAVDEVECGANSSAEPPICLHPGSQAGG